ncbi:MAG: ABC transporter substrate-binding protein [Bacillota bacterium]
MLQTIRTHRRRGRSFILPLLLLLLLLAACSKESEPEVPPPWQGSLTLWAGSDLAGHPGKLEAGWLEERVRAFEGAHKGVTVQVRLFATGEEMEQALLGGAEPKPDLYLGRPLPALGDRLAALAPKPDVLSDHHEGALAAFRRGEAIYGLPVLLDLQVLAINDRAFAARSVPLPPEGGWSESEFYDRLAKISGDSIFGLGFSHAPGYHQWWPLIGGLFTADGAIAPEAEAALSRLAHWRKSGILYPDIARLSTAELYRLFAAEQPRVAVMPVPAWTIPLLRGEPYKAAFTVAGFPGGANVGQAYGFVALSSDDPKRLSTVVDLMTFVAAPDQQVRLARKTGLMPARKSAPNPFDGDSQMTKAFQLAGSFRPLPAGPAFEAAQPAIAQELLLALYGSRAPGEALQEAKKLLEMATTSVK